MTRPTATSVSTVRSETTATPAQGSIYRVLVNMMRDSGCPQELLDSYHRRRSIVFALGQAKRGQGEGFEYAYHCAGVMGLEPVRRFLGRGNWGGSYLLGDNTVLKITTDYREANVSVALVGKRTRRIAETLGVWRFTIHGKPSRYYGIQRERVFHAGSIGGERRVEAKLVLEHAAALTSQRKTPPPMDHEDPVHISSFQTAKEIVGELMEHQIAFEDYHMGNLGTKQGRICLFDLSLAKGPTKEIPLVEAPEASSVDLSGAHPDGLENL